MGKVMETVEARLGIKVFLVMLTVLLSMFGAWAGYNYATNERQDNHLLDHDRRITMTVQDIVWMRDALVRIERKVDEIGKKVP